jgi:hypothetical protein
MVAFCPGVVVSTRTGWPSATARAGSVGTAKTLAVKAPTRSLKGSTTIEWVPVVASSRVS